MTALTFFGFEWVRPLGLVALGVVPIVWWLASRQASTPRLSTGTLDVWREVTRARPSGAQARRKTSLALWLMLASLVCGALALGGPREVSASSSATWRVVLDRSPSMYLPLDGERGMTRIERALVMTREQLAAVMRDGDLIEWIAANGSFSSSKRVTSPPNEWSVAPRNAHDAPRFELFDQRGVLFVTDATPRPEPHEAGWCASGGARTPGFVAAASLQRFTVSGDVVAEPVPVPGPSWRVRWTSAAPPAALRSVFEAWRSARHVDLASADETEIELEIVAADSRAVVDVRAGRDGWSAQCRSRAVQVEAEQPSESWLSAPGPDAPSIDLVRWRPGRIEIGITEMSAPDGYPAAFAISWAKLFDAALLPPQGIVSVDERQAAGESSSRAPARPTTSDTRDVRVYDAWLALAAAACAVLALALRS